MSVAEDEWRKFGSYTRRDDDPERYFTVEDSWQELKGTTDGKRIDQLFAWARVHLYWRATGNEGVLDLAYDIQRDSSGQPKRDDNENIQRIKINLKQALGYLDKASQTLGDTGFPTSAKSALRIAAIRASLGEQPWSAVFISTAMQLAELDSDEFKISGSHSGYMREALAASKGFKPAHRYIACPPDANIRVREGDLVCNARAGTKPGFMTLWNADGGFTSHCDIVVSVVQTSAGFTFQAIGGNVRDTVTRTVYEGSGVASLAASKPAQKWIAVLLAR